ncbi:MAG: hypothetical protein N2A40_05450, partial [Desulfobulbaceae bacterium]
SYTHHDIRNDYHELLKQAGMDEFAGILVGTEERTVKQKVVAVDDSRMILNIYKTTLHELGYEPVLFEFPASALEWRLLILPFVDHRGSRCSSAGSL